MRHEIGYCNYNPYVQEEESMYILRKDLKDKKKQHQTSRNEKYIGRH